MAAATPSDEKEAGALGVRLAGEKGRGEYSASGCTGLASHEVAVASHSSKLIIRSIRDELVELVPGVYLGKILFNSGSDYSKLGYFALRTPR